MICSEIRAWTAFRFRARGPWVRAEGAALAAALLAAASGLLDLQLFKHRIYCFQTPIGNQIHTLALSSFPSLLPSSKPSRSGSRCIHDWWRSRVIDVSNARLCIFYSSST